jgi:cytoplasmic iron level regulating protein YaaA (DUF328/UPF0246 family)
LRQKEVSGRVPAKDLYTSPVFKGDAWICREKHADLWFIISSDYGIISPSDVVYSYEVAIEDMNSEEKLKWTSKVYEQLKKLLPRGADVVILAGKSYREDIIPFLKERGFSVDVPMEHVKQGKRLGWLREHT